MRYVIIEVHQGKCLQEMHKKASEKAGSIFLQTFTNAFFDLGKEFSQSHNENVVHKQLQIIRLLCTILVHTSLAGL